MKLTHPVGSRISARVSPHARRAAGIAAVLAGLALTAACAGSGSVRVPASVPVTAQTSVDASGTQPVTVGVADGMSFEPSTITVKAGVPVYVTLENRGTIDHDLTLGEGVATPVRIVAKGGQTASGTFTIERPGRYQFVCSVPGHALLGMRGTITAQ